MLYNILGPYSSNAKLVKTKSNFFYTLMRMKFDCFVESTEKKTGGLKV